MRVDDPNLKAHYRMPRVFGNLPGPRNVPVDRREVANNQTNTILSVTGVTDQALLQELCPPGCEVDGEPLITATQNFMSNIGWLAGHGYAYVAVTFRIVHQSQTRGPLHGSFTPVVWENLGDAITTGREELGYAKLYAEMPALRVVGDTYSGVATWQGFRFFEIDAVDLADQPVGGDALTVDYVKPAQGMFHYKYVPKTGAQDESDIEYLEYSPSGRAEKGYEHFEITRHMAGAGRFAFHPARWEDVPFQYPIINALAALPLYEFRGATVTQAAARANVGDVSEATWETVQ